MIAYEYLGNINSKLKNQTKSMLYYDYAMKLADKHLPKQHPMH